MTYFKNRVRMGTRVQRTGFALSECVSLFQDSIKMTLERIGKVVVEVYGGRDSGFETCLLRERH